MAAQDDFSAKLDAFIERWSPSGGAEHANYALFLQEICVLLDLPVPEPARPEDHLNTYVLEKSVPLRDPSGVLRGMGRIDLYRQGCFVLETKQGVQAKTGRQDLVEPVQRKVGHGVRGSGMWSTAMLAAKTQAENYARCLPHTQGRPPFVVVVDVGYSIELYSEFTRSGSHYIPFPDAATHRILLERLHDPEIRNRVRQVWLDPLNLDPSKHAAEVTRRVAGYLAELAKSYEDQGHQPEDVAFFLMRCLFTMFAEDIRLLPKESFLGLLRKLEKQPKGFERSIGELWLCMNEGGWATPLSEEILQFNGGLFENAIALPTNQSQIRLLIKAAEANWSKVEPAIFGTLLERALDANERHKLGAHYTPRSYVERLILPIVVEKLRDEWAAVKSAVVELVREGLKEDALGEVLRFHRRLCEVKVLDPACGSGNFLYVSMEHLKRLEGEVRTTMLALGGNDALPILQAGLTVDPHNFLGLEINVRARVIAEMVLWIGYLQWHFRNNGDSMPAEPVLKKFDNVQCCDAVVDGSKPASWPEADFIVGNPPFIGNKRMRAALGDEYVERLREAYPEVPSTADYVMYWWEKAAHLVREGKAERFGFITTNSITQTFNRQIVQRHLEADPPLSLLMAIADHPWVDCDSTAAVRIAMTVGVPGDESGIVGEVTKETVVEYGEHEVELHLVEGKINSDLTTGVDVTGVSVLKANENMSFQGVIPVGEGFRLNEEGLKELRYSAKHLPPVIKPFIIGRDLVQKHVPEWIIDCYGLTREAVYTYYPEIYQHLLVHVKPIRDKNRMKSRKERWWQLGSNAKIMRSALRKLPRFIATPRTSKHRVFVFVNEGFLGDDGIVHIAHHDAAVLGVLSSRIHTLWSLKLCGWMGVGNDLRYFNSIVFSPFPFPDPAPEIRARIQDLGERLDAHRKRQQSLHPNLTITAMYNVLDKLRSREPLTAKEQLTHQEGLVSLLKEIHDELDAAVAEAYGWEWPLSDGEILRRLVALNRERFAEEQEGTIRWLRREFQAPDASHQDDLDLESEEEHEAAPAPPPPEPVKLPWPKSLPEQFAVLRTLLQEAGTALTVEQIDGRIQWGTGRKGDREGRLRSLLSALVTAGGALCSEDQGYWWTL